MKSKKLILCLLIIVLNSCGIDEPDEKYNYPTTLYSLSGDMLSKYINEYRTLNNNQICTSLNNYGYYEYDLAPCMSRSILRTEIKNEAEMETMAKNIVIKNNKYTGVTNIDQLTIERSNGMKGCIKCDGSNDDTKNIKWRIYFNNQIFNGYEVFDTHIIVFLDNNGAFMMGGNWYSNIVIPPSDNYDLEEAKASLDGYKISFICWGEINITVTPDKIKKEARKVIIPYKLDDRIELRLTWEIFITDSNSNPMYVIYVDSITGEIIRENLLINC